MTVLYLIALSTDFSIDPLISGEIPPATLQVDGVTSVETPPTRILLVGENGQWQRCAQ